MLTKKEFNQIAVSLFNSSEVAYPGPKSIVDLSDVLRSLLTYTENGNSLECNITYESKDNDKTLRTFKIEGMEE